MNIKAFLVDALGSALDTGLGSPEDVLRHVTPDVLAEHLPRPLWARLITACLGAPKVDPRLVVETIGMPNLCEHVPAKILWNVMAEIAARALGQPSGVAIPAVPAKTAMGTGPVPRTTTPPSGVAVPTTPVRGVPLAPPPPAAEAPTRSTQPVNPAAARNIPAPGQSLANLDLDDDSPAAPSRSRTPTGQRFRQSQTGVAARTSANAATRRPQAQAGAPMPSATGTPARPGPVVRRGGTDVAEVETETSVEKEWGDREIAVDDEQLVDWQAAEETVTNSEGLSRKR